MMEYSPRKSSILMDWLVVCFLVSIVCFAREAQGVLYRFDFVDADGTIVGMELETEEWDTTMVEKWSVWNLPEVAYLLFDNDGEEVGRLQELHIDHTDGGTTKYELEYDDGDVIQIKSCTGQDCVDDNRMLKLSDVVDEEYLQPQRVENYLPDKREKPNKNFQDGDDLWHDLLQPLPIVNRELQPDFSYLKLDCEQCGPISDAMCNSLVENACTAFGLGPSLSGVGAVGGMAFTYFCDAVKSVKCSPEPGCPGDQYCECERLDQKRCGSTCVDLDVCCPPTDYLCPNDPTNTCILEGSVGKCCPDELCGGQCPEIGEEICCGGQLVPSYTGVCDTCQKRQVCRNELESVIGCVEDDQCCPPYAQEPCGEGDNAVCYNPEDQVCCESGDLRTEEYFCSCDIICHDMNGNELGCADADGCCSEGTAEASLGVCNCQGKKLCYDDSYNVVKCVELDQDCDDPDTCILPTRLLQDERATCVYDSDCDTLGCLYGKCVNGQLGEQCYYDDNRMCQPGLFCVGGPRPDRICVDGNLGSCCDYNNDCNTLGCVYGKCVDGQLGEQCYYDDNSMCQPGLFCVGWPRDERICRDGSFGEKCDYDNDCKTLGCMYGKCADGQLGEQCYYDDNRMCQPGLFCVGSRRDERICRDGSFGEQCDYDNDCKTLGCMYGKCADGQLGEQCYYDDNRMCQPGLICTGWPRPDRICQEGSTTTPTAVPIATPPVNPNPIPSSTSLPTIPDNTVPIITPPVNPNPIPSSTSLPTIPDNTDPIITPPVNPNPIPSSTSLPTVGNEGCESLEIDAEHCLGENNCYEMCDAYWAANFPTDPQPSDCQEANAYCSDYWSCCTECLANITVMLECTLQRDLALVCDLDCANGSSNETMAPTSSLTAVVSPDGGGGFCFSGENWVETPDKGLVRMKELTLGDMVRVANKDKTFEPIYSFGHKNEEVTTEYLSISTHGDSLEEATSKNPSGTPDSSTRHPLEITKDHMVMIPNGGYIPASMLKVGDSLMAAIVLGEDGATTMEIVKVTKIHTVIRQGSYAPFTPSGTIVVNGILSSNYISYGSFPSATVFQWMPQTFSSVHRLIWKLGYQEETYTTEGISHWVAMPHRFICYFLRWPRINQILFCVTVLPLILLLLCLTSLVEYVIT